MHQPITIQIMDVTGCIEYSNRYTAPPTNIITIEHVYINNGTYFIKQKTKIMKTQNYLSRCKFLFAVVAIYFCSMQIGIAQYHPIPSKGSM